MTTNEAGLEVPQRVVHALRRHLQERSQSAEVVQEVAAAYYDDELTFGQLESLIGEQKAANAHVLKEQLDESLTEELAEL